MNNIILGIDVGRPNTSDYTAFIVMRKNEDNTIEVLYSHNKRYDGYQVDINKEFKAEVERLAKQYNIPKENIKYS